MLIAATDFRNPIHKMKEKTIPDTFESIECAKDALNEALLFEAHMAMREPMADSTEPLLSCVDLHTERPGLITEHDADTGNVVVSYQDGTEKHFQNVHDLVLYASPLPYDRHLDGIAASNVPTLLKTIILEGKLPKMPLVTELKEMCRYNKLKVSGVKADLVTRLQGVGALPCLTLYHGPPGTGKTHTILTRLSEMLKNFPERHRFLICAPSNVAVVNLYTRARSWGIRGALVIRDDKIPDGIEFTEDERAAWNPKMDRVVFATVSGRCGSVLRKGRFNTVIMDEAAQCQEAWMWGVLREDTTNIILAGDPRQLPAQVSQDGITMYHGRSIMERLVHLGYPATLLNTQRRMHPEIASFPNAAFYGNCLSTDYHGIGDTAKPYEVIAVEAQELKEGTSYSNETEARVVVSLVKRFKQQFNEVIVISPYKAQCALLKSLDSSVIVHTVDSFQGNEADVIILTTVRSGSTVGFWQDERRVNVALTRAKHALRIVGSVRTWAKGDTIMNRLAEDGKERSLVKCLGPKQIMALGIPVSLQQALKYSKELPWGVPEVNPRAISAVRQDSKLEQHLSKSILQLSAGAKQSAFGIVHTINEDGMLLDWNVDIDEDSKQLRIVIHHVRYQGTKDDIFAEICKIAEKRGPEWNEVCKYGSTPCTFRELPFKGKRFVPAAKPQPRDRARERLQAQAFVAKLRR